MYISQKGWCEFVQSDWQHMKSKFVQYDNRTQYRSYLLLLIEAAAADCC